MGLDCFILAKTEDGMESEIGYFRKFWELHHWMMREYQENGGVFSVDGCDCVDVYLTRSMLTKLFVDAANGANEFADADEYQIEGLLCQVGKWLNHLNSGASIYYYGSY